MYSLSKICVDAWIVFVYGNKSDKNVISHVDFFFSRICLIYWKFSSQQKWMRNLLEDVEVEAEAEAEVWEVEWLDPCLQNWDGQ